MTNFADGAVSIVGGDFDNQSDSAGAEVIRAARAAAYHPAVALLTAFPVADEDWQEMGADQLLVKPMHTRILLEQIEGLIESHERKLAKLGKTGPAVKASAKKAPAKKASAKKVVSAKKVAAKSTAARKPAAKKSVKKSTAKA